ncbi:pleckstrin homology domain-containing family A member 5 isoform X3 [Phyllobates terribilis]|uniref:pleckstrin homology domain-containing family A member 5 isoform X3 n=1 Tax=Phyllobates terribilis TaxID=111132 RepID=UPI003CCB0D0D
MAADPSLEWVSSLPWAWGYGISAGGRVFFINEEAKSTTWLHPATGETVLTGHRKSPDLPTGWEEAYTFEGARYYINHNERKVTCKHPVSGQPSQDNCIFVVNDQPPAAMTSQETKDRTVSVTSDSSNTVPTANPTSPPSRPSRASGKVHNFGKRSNSIKRNPNAPVSMRGWLYKKANSGMKLWKKRWFVLCDLCLFYYRDEKEEGVLGSILLPSFQISPVTADDHINRAHAFKAAHSNMRTYYFYCDTMKEMELWMRAMTGASLVHAEPVRRMDITKLDHPPPQEINHVANHRLLIRPEANNNQKNRELTLARGEEKATREAEMYGFQKDGQERPLTKISSAKPCISDYDILAVSTAQYRAVHVNGPESRVQDGQGHPSETDSRGLQQVCATAQGEASRVIQRTNSMLQLEQWIRSQREKSPEEDGPGGVMSYQTLPRNMPSYRAPMVPRYPEGYKTLPRNLKPRPDSVCSTTGMVYERTLVPVTAPAEEKRRSVRDDTMWQLYEWQQRQFYNKQSTLRRHSSLTSPKTMVQLSEQTVHAIPISPSHGSISGYHTYSPHRTYRSEVSSPVQRGDLTLERRPKPQPSKLGFAPERRSVGLSVSPISPQGLQGKTPEELTLLLIKLRRQQAELSSIREHTLSQLLHLQQSCSPKMTQDDGRTTTYKHRTEELDIDATLSRLCEQDKLVQALEQKLQQLHKEKYTLEQALLSASQEIEMSTETPSAVQSVVLQRDDLQSGLLSTCREVSRATAELERSWREYDKLEREVTTARNGIRERLERLGEVQTEAAGIQRAQMQKEIWRIQDVMEGLSKHKQRRLETGDPKLPSSGLTSGEQGPRPPPRRQDRPPRAGLSEKRIPLCKSRAHRPGLSLHPIPPRRSARRPGLSLRPISSPCSALHLGLSLHPISPLRSALDLSLPLHPIPPLSSGLRPGLLLHPIPPLSSAMHPGLPLHPIPPLSSAMHPGLPLHPIPPLSSGLRPGLLLHPIPPLSSAMHPGLPLHPIPPLSSGLRPGLLLHPIPPLSSAMHPGLPLHPIPPLSSAMHPGLPLHPIPPLRSALRPGLSLLPISSSRSALHMGVSPHPISPLRSALDLSLLLHPIPPFSSALQPGLSLNPITPLHNYRCPGLSLHSIPLFQSAPLLGLSLHPIPPLWRALHPGLSLHAISSPSSALHPGLLLRPISSPRSALRPGLSLHPTSPPCSALHLGLSLHPISPLRSALDLSLSLHSIPPLNSALHPGLSLHPIPPLSSALHPGLSLHPIPPLISALYPRLLLHPIPPLCNNRGPGLPLHPIHYSTVPSTWICHSTPFYHSVPCARACRCTPFHHSAVPCARACRSTTLQ